MEKSSLFFLFEPIAAVAGRGILLLSVGFGLGFCFSAAPLPQTSPALRTMTHASPPKGSWSMRGTRLPLVRRGAALWLQT